VRDVELLGKCNQRLSQRTDRLSRPRRNRFSGRDAEVDIQPFVAGELTRLHNLRLGDVQRDDPTATLRKSSRERARAGSEVHNVLPCQSDPEAGEALKE